MRDKHRNSFCGNKEYPGYRLLHAINSCDKKPKIYKRKSWGIESKT